MSSKPPTPRPLDPETLERIQDHLDTERILNRQRRNRIMGKRIAWTIFWLVIAAAVTVLSVALSDTLVSIMAALENP